jgi:hypothetical protein
MKDFKALPLARLTACFARMNSMAAGAVLPTRSLSVGPLCGDCPVSAPDHSLSCNQVCVESGRFRRAAIAHFLSPRGSVARPFQHVSLLMSVTIRSIVYLDPTPLPSEQEINSTFFYRHFRFNFGVIVNRALNTVASVLSHSTYCLFPSQNRFHDCGRNCKAFLPWGMAWWIIIPLQAPLTPFGVFCSHRW